MVIKYDKYCTRIDKYKTLCNIAGCVKSVTGVKRTLYPPTDNWVLHLNDNTMYKDIPIKDAYMKIWINIRSARQYERKVDETFIQGPDTPFDQLDNEVYVYQKMISPMIDSNNVTNFPRFLGSALNCSFKALHAIIDPELGEDSKNRLIRNLMTLTNVNTPTKDINDPLTSAEEDGLKGYAVAIKQFKYNFIVFKTLPENTIDLRLYTMKYNVIPYDVFMQILVAVYAMDYHNITHNLLKPSKILMAPVSKTTVTYRFTDKADYTFETSWKVIITDFKHAHFGAAHWVWTEKEGMFDGRDYLSSEDPVFPEKVFQHNINTYQLVYRMKDIIDSVQNGHDILNIVSKTGKHPTSVEDVYPIPKVIARCYCYVTQGEPIKKKASPDSTFTM